jgi:hypothetical protein
MKNKELLYFVGMCLTIDKNPENLIKVKDKIHAGIIDWTKFVALCSNHLITPAIYPIFRKTNILSLLSEDLQSYLKEIYELSFLRNQMILEQIIEICNLLATINIYPILLKGAGNLTDNLYPDLAVRIMGDIDLLVTEDEYLAAAQILINSGYTESKLFYCDDLKLLKHYPRLLQEDKAAAVEIHRIPVDEDYLKWFNQDMIRKNIKNAECLPYCHVLSDEDKVILNFIHSQLTNKGDKSGVLMLRDIYDLYLLSGRVNLNHLFPLIKPNRKAGDYFFLSQKILGVNIGYLANQGLSGKWLHFKHDFNFKSKFFYSTNKIITELYDRILVRYFGLIFKSFYSKKVRSFMFMRLRNQLWYKSQINSWKNTFKL